MILKILGNDLGFLSTLSVPKKSSFLLEFSPISPPPVPPQPCTIPRQAKPTDHGADFIQTCPTTIRCTDCFLGFFIRPAQCTASQITMRHRSVSKRPGIFTRIFSRCQKKFHRARSQASDIDLNDADYIEQEFQLLNQHFSGLGISQDFMLEMRDVFQQFDKVLIINLKL